MTAAHVVSATPLGVKNLVGMRTATVVVTLSNSYPTGGGAVDLSTSGPLGQLGFKTVHAAVMGAHVTAGSSVYEGVFVPAALNAPATGLLKVHDLGAVSDAEVSSTTDLSLSVIRLQVYGT